MSRQTRRTREIVGCIIPPGLHWAKYLVHVSDGTYEIMYEGDLMDVCRRGDCVNGHVVTREKRAYDDWDAGPELHTTPADLLDEHTIHLRWADVAAGHQVGIRRAAEELIERATGKYPVEELVIDDLTTKFDDPRPSRPARRRSRPSVTRRRNAT